MNIKKILYNSIIVLIVLSVISPNAGFADGIPAVLTAESFDGYATYEKPGSLNINGFRYYISEYETHNKGLLFELSGTNQKISFGSSAEGAYFISFDISANCKLNGSLKANMGTELTLLNFSEGVVTTHNNLDVFGIKGVEKTVGIFVDPASKTYTLFENGKAKLSGFYHSSIPAAPLTGFSLEFSSKDDNAAVILDNVFAKSGAYADSAK